MFLPSSGRSSTNSGAFIFCLCLVAALFVLIGIHSYRANVFIFINGYDDCGNVCGRKNDQHFVEIGSCKAEDMTSKPYTMWTNVERLPDNSTVTHSKCVDHCPEDYNLIVNRCIQKNANSSLLLSEDAPDTTSKDEMKFFLMMTKTLIPLIVSIGAAFIFSYGVLILFRVAMRQLFWGIHIMIIVSLVIGSFVCTVFAISSASKSDSNSAVKLMIVAMVFATIAIFSACILSAFRRRIEIVIQIFKEASKTLIDMTALMFEPVLTFCWLIIALLVYSAFFLVVKSAGHLQVYESTFNLSQNTTYALYETSSFQNSTQFFTIFMFYWFINFIVGCQNFIIASAVCQWYFLRDKTQLKSPVSRAFSHLMKFHIGTICFGSFFMTIVGMLMQVIRSITQKMRTSRNIFVVCLASCIQSLFEAIERLLKFLLRNAYIIVALEGTPMITSGKRAVMLLEKHLFDVYAVNVLGGYILTMTKILVAVLVGGLCFWIMPDKDAYGYTFAIIPAIIGLLIAYLIIHCFMTVFEMAVDTIFLCYCVDVDTNDGSFEKQYHMSVDMMQTMDEIKGLAQNPTTTRYYQGSQYQSIS